MIMVMIQIDIPKKLDKDLKIYSVTEDLNDKRNAVIKILDEYFNK